MQRNPICGKYIFEKVGALYSLTLAEFYQQFLEETESINNIEFIQSIYNDYNKE